MIELLSPAGDLERLKIAALYGADAIYIGGKSFGLRANATNFDIDEIKEAASFLHKLNKKLYVNVPFLFFKYVDICFCFLCLSGEWNL